MRRRSIPVQGMPRTPGIEVPRVLDPAPDARRTMPARPPRDDVPRSGEGDPFGLPGDAIEDSLQRRSDGSQTRMREDTAPGNPPISIPEPTEERDAEIDGIFARLSGRTDTGVVPQPPAAATPASLPARPIQPPQGNVPSLPDGFVWGMALFGLVFASVWIYSRT